MPLTYAEALAEAEQRILNGARAYNFARATRYSAASWFEWLMWTRPIT